MSFFSLSSLRRGLAHLSESTLLTGYQARRLSRSAWNSGRAPSQEGPLGRTKMLLLSSDPAVAISEAYFEGPNRKIPILSPPAGKPYILTVKALGLQD